MTCKDEADLHEEYARVIRMCVGTKVKSRDCVRFAGLNLTDECFFLGGIP